MLSIFFHAAMFVLPLVREADRTITLRRAEFGPIEAGLSVVSCDQILPAIDPDDCPGDVWGGVILVSR
jgi:hypothetical protein